MITAIEMTHTDYLACHTEYRRIVRGQKELLVLDKATGKQTWIPVKIIPDREAAKRT